MTLKVRMVLMIILNINKYICLQYCAEDSQTEKSADFFHINQTDKMECSVLVWIIAIFLIY